MGFCISSQRDHRCTGRSEFRSSQVLHLAVPLTRTMRPSIPNSGHQIARRLPQPVRRGSCAMCLKDGSKCSNTNAPNRFNHNSVVRTCRCRTMAPPLLCQSVKSSSMTRSVLLRLFTFSVDEASCQHTGQECSTTTGKTVLSWLV